MFPDTDDSAIQADAYIESLLTGHKRAPVAVVDHPALRTSGVQDAIRLLEKGLPRFHPSFLFEEWLAEQLRRAGDGTVPIDSVNARARIVPIAVIPPSGGMLQARRQDRRLLVGGAIASGVSIAGAAMLAWRRGRRRGWVS